MDMSHFDTQSPIKRFGIQVAHLMDGEEEDDEGDDSPQSSRKKSDNRAEESSNEATAYQERGEWDDDQNNDLGNDSDNNCNDIDGLDIMNQYSPTRRNVNVSSELLEYSALDESFNVPADPPPPSSSKGRRSNQQRGSPRTSVERSISELDEGYVLEQQTPRRLFDEGDDEGCGATEEEETVVATVDESSFELDAPPKEVPIPVVLCSSSPNTRPTRNCIANNEPNNAILSRCRNFLRTLG